MKKIKKFFIGVLSIFGVTFGGDVVVQQSECEAELVNFEKLIKNDKLKKKDFLFEIEKEDCRYFNNTEKKKQVAYQNVVIIDDDVTSGVGINDNGEPVFENITDIWKYRGIYNKKGIKSDKEMKERLKKDKVKTFNIIFKKYNE